MQTYDYIVVGAGPAGAAVANRLSADLRNKVLLLEAGRASHPWSFIPIGMARLIKNPAANWLYSSEPEASTNGRRLPVPRGKLLGGSSSINGMVFVRRLRTSIPGRRWATVVGATMMSCRSSGARRVMPARATTHFVAGRAAARDQPGAARSALRDDHQGG